jgi:hypothetical protein
VVLYDRAAYQYGQSWFESYASRIKVKGGHSLFSVDAAIKFYGSKETVIKTVDAKCTHLEAAALVC